MGFIYEQTLTTWMKLNLVIKLTHMDENGWKDNIDEADISTSWKVWYHMDENDHESDEF
jgi:hypothetical protein